MTDLIKAAVALAEAVKEQLAYMDMCNDKGDLERDMRNALTTFHQARESADGVKVKPLVWECEGGWRWKGTPPDGFFASVAKWVWQAPKGGFKHAGTKELFATLEEAKAAAQADYEARIKAALEG
ncbi:hypothetical protein VWZ88_12730 [Phaeobacter sp. JH20_36]|uniref:hypothetical protein n=1 Tax=unclassified Phaeobacter TaxID=2621772 RepID=UPI003A88D66F